MIKNFVVKVKPIKYEDKGLKNFLNYLEDEKRHPNGIIKIKQFNKENFFKNTILNITEHQINKRGRKTKNYADSYIFTIPPNLYEKISNDKKVLKDILKTLIDNIYEELREDFPDLKKNELTKQLFVNIHTDKKHIHINVIFPRVFKIQEKLYSNRTTGRKKFLNNIKNRWNANLLKNLNISINDYKPTTKLKKGYKSKYFKEQIEKIIELKELIEKQRKEIKETLTKLEEKNKEKEEIVKKMTLIIRYYKKFKKYLEVKEKEKAKQEYFKAKNKIKQIEKHKLGKTTKKILNQIKGDLNSYDFGM